MIEPRCLKILRMIHTRLNDTDVNWVLTGSLSFALQGVPVEVHDIDIQTDKAGVYEIERLFADFVIKKVNFASTEKIRSHFGTLMIYDIKVDIMGNIQKQLEDGTWEDPVDLNPYKQFVEVEGMQIPVLPLDYEYHAYLKLGRIEKAEMLRKYLASHKGT